MATIHDFSTDLSPAAGPFDDYGAALEPPRFSLRALFGAVTVAGCLFGLMSTLGLVWSAAITTLLVLALAHVMGNSSGTRLRDQSSRGTSGSRADARRSAGSVLPLVAAPQRLTQRGSLGRWTLLMTVGGAAAGALLGGAGSAGLYPEAPATAVALGVVSLAVLGGFAGFAVCSFISVARGAMREALCGCDAAVRRASRPSR